VIGSDFNPQANHLHGSVLGLIVGLAGLLYGAQGVTQQAQSAMVTIWDTSDDDRPASPPGSAELGRPFRHRRGVRHQRVRVDLRHLLG